MREAATRSRSWGVLVAPAALNCWPALLLVSQKALLPLALFGSRVWDRALARHVGWVILLAVAGLTVMIPQGSNDFIWAHYLGFVGFLVFVPFLLLALRVNRSDLIGVLSLFTVINSVLATLAYLVQPDLSGFRGLNLIENQYGDTNRVYVESTCFAAVYTSASFRGWLTRRICDLVVAFYVMVLARSVFILCLVLANRLFPYFLRATAAKRLIIGLVALALGVLLSSIMALYRPDFLLSTGIKALQFESILGQLRWVPWGLGWGYSIDDVATSVDQPYQVEMQLPMLFVQLGWAYALAFVGALAAFIWSVGGVRLARTSRVVTYLVAGFVNPWILLPGWLLTCCLMYGNEKEDRRLV